VAVDMDALSTFVVAARTENFRRTARLRFLAQASVTQHIRRLEAELGVPLFERRGRRVRLSEAGAAFLPHAERMLAAGRAGALAARSAAEDSVRPLRIAASPHVAGTFLPALLRRWTEPWTLEVVPSTEVAARVADGSADVGLTRARPSDGRLVVERVVDDPLVLVAPHDGLDLEREAPFFDALLASEVVFTYEPVAIWSAVEAALAQRGVTVARTMPVAQVGIAKAFVLRGLGVSFLPRSAVAGELRLGWLLDVPTPGVALPTDEIHLLHRGEGDRTVDRFAALARRGRPGDRAGGHEAPPGRRNI
jgi:LysR family transcriptional repressor of citA